jgi:hypothetical protein
MNVAMLQSRRPREIYDGEATKAGQKPKDGAEDKSKKKTKAKDEAAATKTDE